MAKSAPSPPGAMTLNWLKQANHNGAGVGKRLLTLTAGPLWLMEWLPAR